MCGSPRYKMQAHGNARIIYNRIMGVIGFKKIIGKKYIVSTYVELSKFNPKITEHSLIIFAKFTISGNV